MELIQPPTLDSLSMIRVCDLAITLYPSDSNQALEDPYIYYNICHSVTTIDSNIQVITIQYSNRVET